jgi:hypothetical protein
MEHRHPNPDFVLGVMVNGASRQFSGLLRKVTLLPLDRRRTQALCRMRLDAADMPRSRGPFPAWWPMI